MKHFQKLGVWGVRSLSILQRMWVWSSEYSQIQKAGSWPVFKTWPHSIQIWIAQSGKKKKNGAQMDCSIVICRQKRPKILLWCWRRLLRVPWTASRSNQSILKEINPEYSLEGLMLQLKLQYFGHLMQKADSEKRPWCWERLRARREGDDRGWDGWMASLTQWTGVWANSGRWCMTGKPGMLRYMGLQS